MEALKLRENSFIERNYFVEESIDGFDGKSLHLESWIPECKPWAILLLVHSLSDHINRYEPLAKYFTANGIAVMGLDLRGHGKSKGNRKIDKYQNLLHDVQRLAEYAQIRYPNIPKIIYGHGLGGNLALAYAIRHNPSVTGVISSSPWIRAINNRSPLYMSALRMIKRVYPAFIMKNRFKCTDLTHDRECVKIYNKDPLIHRYMSARLFFSLQESGEYLLHNKHKINKPLLLMHGSSDKITSWRATADFAKYTSPNTTFKIWKGAYHELHHEFEKEDIFEYILHWINNLPGIH